ncbi:MAG: hypothetical protein LBG80_04580 [Bacteroidales bacterium]|jgi:hypothetical protein|nr:hypothetical protein [Bacteroidales bacterium]
MIIHQIDAVQQGTAGLKDAFGLSSLADALIYIGGAILTIGLVGLIWAFATNKQHATQYLIAWLIGVAFYCFIADIF